MYDDYISNGFDIYVSICVIKINAFLTAWSICHSLVTGWNTSEAKTERVFATIAVFGLRIIQKLATIYLNPVTNHTMHDSKQSMIWLSSLSSKTPWEKSIIV